MSTKDKNQKILIVDDKIHNLKVLTSILTEHNYIVQPAINGSLALNAVNKTKPDLILLDINMPGIDGFEVCKRLKEDESAKDIPIVFVSANISIEDKVKGFQVGAVDYITKPYQVEEVLARVQTHLSVRGMQIELNKRNLKLEKTLAELKNTQDKLIQSEKMASLGQLTAGIAHEINNPLNFIQGNTVALSKDVEDLRGLLAKYKEAQFQGGITSDQILAFEKKIDLETLNNDLKMEIEGIREGTRRTSEIVSGLREFSQEASLKKEPTDIHHGIDVTLNLLASRLTKDIEIMKNYDESIGEIDCHIGQLNQVFLNLFLNALDAIGEKGKIEVSTKKEKKCVRISIKDDGVGISRENQKKVFDPFFTTKEVGKGTGLGLSISHGIIENHGGKIEVKSEDGRGTEFIIQIPK